MYYKSFTLTTGEKSINVGYIGGERFKNTNKFYQLFMKFFNAIYSVAWLTGGFSVSDPYVKAAEYYEWGEENGWFEQLLKEIRIWNKKLKRGIGDCRDVFPSVGMVHYKDKCWFWFNKY